MESQLTFQLRTFVVVVVVVAYTAGQVLEGIFRESFISMLDISLLCIVGDFRPSDRSVAA